ncbi:MAG: carboxynorspermidine decarboxylase [Elusimicrobia bacterium]|nr:carboxynorspermidine decarboxylase [Elusimicrobiota bacterium]
MKRSKPQPLARPAGEGWGEIARSVKPPCFVVHEGLLDRNLAVLGRVQAESGAKILLALKGFALPAVFPRLRRTLPGTTASSLHEARLAVETFGGEVHLCAPAYRPDEFPELLRYADHVTFNSLSQWERWRGAVASSGRKVSCGLRVNPEHREVEVALYDPCAPRSRLGITASNLKGASLDGIEGLHFHSLCELGSDALERTLRAVEAKFAWALEAVKWVNFGGGHHITRPGYDVSRLIRLVSAFQRHWGVSVYLEPGEAVALHTGALVASVLDIVHNGIDIAILDTSATNHMPDVLEMPYRPQIVGAGKKGEFPHLYRLGGMTCLAGDVIGDYSFPKRLSVGDRLVFLDMAHYSIVKTTTFNGVTLPDIAVYDPAKGVTVVRHARYDDYKSRLTD